jgi:hypothetical protein
MGRLNCAGDLPGNKIGFSVCGGIFVAFSATAFSATVASFPSLAILSGMTSAEIGN